MIECRQYEIVRVLPDGTRCGLHRMMFTSALLVGISKDGLEYERRYCYPDFIAAFAALIVWDGNGDPPGPWIKEKPGDRLGPGALGDGKEKQWQ